MHDAGWGWWLLMSIGMVAFWALIIAGVSGSPADDPPKFARKRLASAPMRSSNAVWRGEISIDEYDQLHETSGAVPREPVPTGDEVSAASVR